MSNPIFYLLLVQFTFFVFFAFQVMAYIHLQSKVAYKLMEFISDFEIYEALLGDDDL